MSVRRKSVKKVNVGFSWQRSLSILAPWRKGKGDVVLDTEVVLTKMKLFNNVHEKLLFADDSLSTISLASVSEQDVSEPIKTSEVNSNLEDMSGQPLVESSSDYLSAIFSDSKLPRLYKFESEDSGVELPSGANSPSTPTGSEQSFVVHSRESSCDSSNLNTPGPSLIPQNTHSAQCSSMEEAEVTEDISIPVDTQKCAVVNSEEFDSSIERAELHTIEDFDGVPEESLEGTPEPNKESSEEAEDDISVPERAQTENTRPRSQCSTGACDDMTGVGFEQQPLRKSNTSDSLEDYMDECCRLSEVQQAGANPMGSGLGYLEHICQLIEKIGQLQETNLRLQRQICGLQKDGRLTKTKEDFFQQHCNCGAASLAFQDVKRLSRSEFPSSSGVSDLTTIPEVTRHPVLSARRDVGGEAIGQPVLPVPLWRRGLNRRSYTEGEARYLCDSSEGLPIPRRRQSENYTWGRVKDLVKKTRLRNKNRLGLSSPSLKMSCPQLYRPDLGSVELPGRNRNSMIALGHQNKSDFPWLQ